MQFKFDANQDYQVRAIASIADLFEGQPKIESEISFSLSAGLGAVANRLDISENTLLRNLQAVQAENDFPADSELLVIQDKIDTVEGEREARFANFSVEMETGTGKTYVYLRTALELNRRFGLRKFIIVVPSLAVREGVLKALEITKKHLRELFDNVPYRHCVYDSSNLNDVRQFALSDAVEIMIMTIDSFNKASNVIRQSSDRLQGETPIHFIQAARPILILDEPQNMESELRIKALAALNPLLALRYSATHRNPYNVVYRLTPYDAYRQDLVKKIEVASVVQTDDENRPFLRLEDLKTVKNTVTARISVHKLMKNGTVREKAVTVRAGDKLEAKTSRPDYASYEVEEISVASRFVRFTNGIEIRVGETQGTDKEAIFRAQIRTTIEEHFRKQNRLKSRGIKVLSLFFIDRVDNYAREDGIIRALFNQEFNDLKKDYADWRAKEVSVAQAAYFAARKTRAGEIILEDSVSGETERDRQAYELIMRNKEQLLSFDEPTAFIFSHSALREGWDNPNVFQICTLNQTGSEMKKRQEIGRGIRLAVNQQGDRIYDESINLLTVIANQSYETYVSRLQEETEQEYGREGLPPPPRKHNAPKAKLRKARALSREFKDLWGKISQKTRYSVKIDSQRLISDVVKELKQIQIAKPRIVTTKAHVGVAEEHPQYTTAQTTGSRTIESLSGRYPMPNLLAVMDNLLRLTQPPVRLTRKTLLEIYKRSSQEQAAIDNPYGFASEAVRIIKEKLADQLVGGIQYEKINEWYEMARILDENETELFGKHIVHTGDSRAVYSHIGCDSAVERRFVEDLEQREDVKLYLKLPGWFKVYTPIGKYNPDWAIVMDNNEPGEPILYLVRETKDPDWRTSLRSDERRKIECGQRHFQGALKVNYKVVSSASELP